MSFTAKNGGGVVIPFSGSTTAGRTNGDNVPDKIIIPDPNAPGLSTYRNLDLDETGVVVKASAGALYGWFNSNLSSGTRYLKLYDQATPPTSADTPKLTLPFGAGVAANVLGTIRISFTIGIGARVTTGIADDDTGAPGTNDFVGNLFFI